MKPYNVFVVIWVHWASEKDFLTPNTIATARKLGNMALRSLLVDVHTHIYLPRYASVLRSRSDVPRIFRRTTPSGQSEDRLLILDNEPSGGRPMGPQVRR